MKILFVSHNASRTGAPILLLSFLRWLKLHTDIQCEIILREGGELFDDFKEAGVVHTFRPERPPRGKQFLWQKLYWNLREDIERKYYLKALSKQLKESKFSAVYSNTIANGEVLDFLRPLNIATISHVHELEDIIHIFMQSWLAVKENTSHYIAASNAVRDNLVRNHGLTDKNISVVHEFIPPNKTTPSSFSRTALGLPEGAFIVCGSGTAEWRKGPDLFILLAERVIRLFGPMDLHFVWVGGWANRQEQRRASDLVEKLNLGEHITFTGSVANAVDYFHQSDVFAMVSREDPFPLVCLEAAQEGKPILCFDKGGGMPELVENDAGFVVPYCDVQAMADKVQLLRSQPDLCAQLGARAKEKVLQRYNVDAGCKRLMEIITSVVSDHST